jgi:LmbE family N-acetylglucosaminyl deacetylase
MFIFAHPDDESLGASALISRNSKNSSIIFATDGMPPPKTDAEYYPPYTTYPPFGSAYSQYRISEATQALSKLGIDKQQISFLQMPDSRIIDSLDIFTQKIFDIIDSTNIKLLYTHAYEGGHIDHDLVCFAVWNAVQKTQNNIKEIIEIPIYNFEHEEYNHNLPLDTQKEQAEAIWLTTEELKNKQKAISNYPSQTVDTQYFDIKNPEFHIKHKTPVSLNRFQEPPHKGALQYENDNLNFQDFLNAIDTHI